MNYQLKYLKYKKKYINLKMSGGSDSSDNPVIKYIDQNVTTYELENLCYDDKNLTIDNINSGIIKLLKYMNDNCSEKYRVVNDEFQFNNDNDKKNHLTDILLAIYDRYLFMIQSNDKQKQATCDMWYIYINDYIKEEAK